VLKSVKFNSLYSSDPEHFRQQKVKRGKNSCTVYNVIFENGTVLRDG